MLNRFYDLQAQDPLWKQGLRDLIGGALIGGVVGVVLGAGCMADLEILTEFLGWPQPGSGSFRGPLEMGVFGAICGAILCVPAGALLGVIRSRRRRA